MNNEDSDIEKFAAQLKMIRSVLGLTQEELAKKLGVARQTISSIEKGTMKLSKPVFIALLGLLLATITTNPILSPILAGFGIKNLLNKYLGYTNEEKKEGERK